MSGTRIDLYKIDYHHHHLCFIYYYIPQPQSLFQIVFFIVSLFSLAVCGSQIICSCPVSLLLFVFRVRERTLFDRLRWLLNRRGRRFFVSFYRLRFDGFATMVGLCISGWAGTLSAERGASSPSSACTPSPPVFLLLLFLLPSCLRTG